MHHVVTWTNFDTFRGIMAIVNVLMMCGCLYLASKMARGIMTRTAFMAVTLFLAFVLGCLVIELPLNENQPQIVVSFLVLLGIERDRVGHLGRGRRLWHSRPP